VVSNRMGMEGARVNCAATSIGGKEFRECRVKVVRNKGGNDVFIAVGNNKKVACADGVEVVLPTQAREYTRLGAGRTRSASFYVSVHCFGLQRLGFSLLIQDHSHGRDRGRRAGWDVFDEGWYDGGGVGGIGGRCDQGCDRHAVMKVRGRNRKWLRTWAIRVVGVSVVG